MLDPRNADDLARLDAHIRRSDRALAQFRTKRLDFIKEQIGVNYADKGADKKVPLPYLRRAKQTYVRFLASRSPRVLVTADRSDLKWLARLMRAQVNDRIREMRAHVTLAEIVEDAVELVGVAKIGMERVWKTGELGVFHDYGETFLERVDLDDLVCDMDATDVRKMRYIGDRYTVPLDEARECPMFEPAACEKLTATGLPRTNEDGTERVQEITGGEVSGEELEECIELTDLWMPRENLMLTLSLRGQPILLAAREWDGPESGPYEWLAFGRVTGQAMPFSPLAMALDLHKLANSLARKASDQAEGQKTVVVGMRGSDEDNQAMADAADGQFIALVNPDRAKQLAMGGVHPGNLAFLLNVGQWTDEALGSQALLSGARAGSPTLGQDELLMASASAQMADHQQVCLDFTRRCMEQLAWYWYSDPRLVWAGEDTLPYTDITVPYRVTPDMREADWWQFHFQVHPYSMRYISPQERLAVLRQFIQDIAPMLPMLQQQGISLDGGALIALYADYTGTPEILEVIEAMRPLERPVGEGEGMPKPPVTTRNYVRTGRPGMTQGGQARAMATQLMAGMGPEMGGVPAAAGPTQ